MDSAGSAQKGQPPVDDLRRALGMLPDGLDDISDERVEERLREVLGESSGSSATEEQAREGIASLAQYRESRDPAMLDRAIDILQRSLTTGSAGNDEGDVRFTLATAYHDRYAVTGVRADLDAAIAHHTASEDPAVNTFFASLFGMRAEQTRDAADARHSAQLFESAVDHATDREQRLELLRYAALAHRLVFDFDGDVAALERAVAQLEEAIHGGPDELLGIHLQHLSAVFALWQGSTEPDRTPAEARLRRSMRAAADALDSSTTDEVTIRSWLVVVLGAAELALDSGTLADPDVARLRAMLADPNLVLTPDVEAQRDGLLTLLDWRNSATPAAPFDTNTPMGLVAESIGTLAAQRWADDAWSADSTGPVETLRLYTALTDDLRRGDLPAARNAVRRASTLLDGQDLSGIEREFGLMIRAIGVMLDPGADTPPDATAIEQTLTAPPHPIRNPTYLALLGAMVASGTARQDASMLERAAALGERVLASLGPDDDRLGSVAACMAGTALLQATRLTGSVASTVQAGHFFDRAAALAGGLHSPLWAIIAAGRAHARRAAGPDGADASRRHAFTALGAYAWQVLTAATADEVARAAAIAAGHAETLVEWCRTDLNSEAPTLEDLLRAFDCAQFPAEWRMTAHRPIADALYGHGRHDLAAEWRSIAGQGRDLVADTLAVSPLGRSPVGPEVTPRLVERTIQALHWEPDPPSSGDIRSALARAGYDALVHLRPGDGAAPGMAVIVAAAEQPQVLILPELVSGQPVTRRFMQSLASPTPATLDAVEQVCSWAWQVAMGPLLDRLQLTHGQLVLVPSAELALVPWHAAFDSRPGERRSVIHTTAVSYAPSARAWCAVVNHDRAAFAQSLVIGASGGGLTEVRRDFYPTAIAVTGTGQRSALMRSLDEPADRHRTMLLESRLAASPADPHDARLVLADSETLSVKELQAYVQDRGIELADVILPNARLIVRADDPQQYFHPGLSFVAAGARTVVSALWPVPDHIAGLLLYQFHRHLRDGLPAAEALRRAQLWLLTQDASTLTEFAAKPRHPATPARGATSITAWAGFAHFGC